jgi:hypothetical protein
MSEMMAEPVPSTLIESSSTDGLRPRMMISFGPGWCTVRQMSCVGVVGWTYLERDVLDIANDLGAGGKQGHGSSGQVADAILLLGMGSMMLLS